MDSRTGQLLQTKLQRPRLARGLVLRPRLIQALNEGVRGPLTLVCAAAGYGKTTLVSSWIESLTAGQGTVAPERVAWIALDEMDREPDLFLRYFVAGVRTVFPGACGNTLELLQARQDPPMALLVATFSNDIAQLPSDFVIVLDDHQSIGASAVTDFLSELIRHWPQPMHLVLISRHAPALPLGRLRAKGQLTEIRTVDLRFNADEAAAFVRSSLPDPLGQAATEALQRSTEGWIAGLQLATLSLRKAEHPEAILAALPDTDTDFADYLMNDVLEHEPAPVLNFLWQTALLEHFCPALCEAVMDARDPEWSAARCVRWLERRNLFMIALDKRGEWYRYHPMFRSLLLQRALLQQRGHNEPGPDRISGVQRRAAGWFAQRGLADEALRYAQAAGDLELTAQLIEGGLRDVLNREDRPALDRRLRMLPDAVIEKRPGLLMAKAWSLQLSWQLGAQARILARAAALLEKGAGTESPGLQLAALRGQAALLQGQQAYFNNHLADAIALCRQALELLPQDWLYVRGGSMMYLGLAMQASGQGQEAERILIEEYEALGDKTSPYALRLLLTLCWVYYLQAGDLERVRQTAQRLSEGAAHGLSILQNWAHYWLGLVHYQRNEPAAAREHLARLADNPYTAQAGVLRDGVKCLAMLDQTVGRPSEARPSEARPTEARPTEADNGGAAGAV